MPRILFVKTSSLGDVVHHCPAVSDAAHALHGAEIDWVVEESFAEIASMHRAVRCVIPVAVRRWRRSLWSARVWSEIGAFRRKVVSERYDWVIDSQGLLKSALLALCANGERHGFDRASAREPIAARFYRACHGVPRDLHAVERNRQLTASALGYEIDTPCEYGLRAQGAAPLETGKPYAVLLTMTSRADKLWPERHWIELGRSLALRGLPALLPWGSDAERRRCERIALAIPEARVPRRLSLAELARLFRGARGVVGLDTGLSHLAVAVGVPVVGIFCGSDPALTGLHGSAHAANLGGPGKLPSPREAREALEALW
jgi:heptosyltransferase-1